MITYEEIEDKIIAALQDLHDTVGVKDIRPYSGEVSPDNVVDIMFRYPAIFVHVDGLVSQPNNLTDRRDIRIVIHVGDISLRANEGAHGAYNVMEAVRGKLNRFSISKGFSPLTLQEERVIAITEEGIALMRAIYEFSGLVAVKEEQEM